MGKIGDKPIEWLVGKRTACGCDRQPLTQQAVDFLRREGHTTLLDVMVLGDDAMYAKDVEDILEFWLMSSDNAFGDQEGTLVQGVFGAFGCHLRPEFNPDDGKIYFESE